MMEKQDFIQSMEVNGKSMGIFNINGLEERGIANIQRLPISIRILVENLLRIRSGIQSWFFFRDDFLFREPECPVDCRGSENRI